MEIKPVGKNPFISFVVIFLLATAVVVSFSFIISRRHTEMREILAKKKLLEGELSLAQKKNMELHRLRDALLYDPVQIEKEAREQLGYKMPDEVIYKRYDFPVKEVGPEGEQKDGLSGKGIKGLINKLGVFGLLVVVIIGVAIFYYGTYWYECRRIRS